VGRALLAQHVPHGDAHRSDELLQLRLARGRLQVLDDVGLGPAVANQGQRITGRAALRVVVDGDFRHGVLSQAGFCPASYQACERLTTATTASITGTSMSTPTTVASAAPDWKPNRLMAAATASSK